MTKRIDREGPIHRTVLAFLRHVLPNAAIHHSPNEMNMGGNKVAKAIAQNKAKSLGMQPGWPDIEVAHDGRFFAFEVKAEGGRLTEHQKAVRAKLEANGIPYFVVRSIEDVRESLEELGIEIRGTIT